MSSDAADSKTTAGKSSTGRVERRQEWWAKHKEARSKLRDRSTLSKKENFQMHQLSLPKVDTSRGFRSTAIDNLMAAAKKSPSGGNKPVPHHSKQKNTLKAKTKPQKPDLNEKPKAVVRGMKRPQPAAAPTVKPAKSAKPAETKEEIMSEVVIKTKDVYEDDVSSANHIPSNYVLFVGNLPHSITREQLMDHFRKTGGVKSVRIPKEKGSGKGRGFAYMEFKSRISLGIALRLHNTTLAGRKINVEFSTSDRDRSKGKVKQENGADVS